MIGDGKEGGSFLTKQEILTQYPPQLTPVAGRDGKWNFFAKISKDNQGTILYVKPGSIVYEAGPVLPSAVVSKDGK